MRIKKILAESSGLDLGFQVAVGCAHHPHLNLLVFLSADAAELAILQELQEFGLQRWIKLGNLVEK